MPISAFCVAKDTITGCFFLRKINAILVALQIEYICKIKKIDTIWITDIRLYHYLKYIKSGKRNITLIYDCMDDTLAFPKIAKNNHKVAYLSKDEQDLLKASHFIFASSETLLNRLKNITVFSSQQQYKVINNALDEAGQAYISLDDEHPFSMLYKKYKQEGFTILIYVGTIASWLDIQSIQKSLSVFTDIVYFFVGPIEIDLPCHQRVIHIKPVEHVYVKDIMCQADILIMPFIVNQLIESVDPVKMYEYISCHKPIIATAYNETFKFSRYAQLYHSPEEYCNYIDAHLKKLDQRVMVSQEEIKSFVRDNTWKNRVSIINEMLQG